MHSGEIKCHALLRGTFPEAVNIAPGFWIRDESLALNLANSSIDGRLMGLFIQLCTHCSQQMLDVNTKSTVAQQIRL